MKRWLRLGLQILSLILFGLILWLGGPDTWRQVLAGDPGDMLIALLLIGIAGMLSATRLQMMSRAIAISDLAPWRRFYYLNTTLRALGLVAPRSLSTLAGKPVALRAWGISLGRSIWIVLTDNLFDVGLLSALAIPALFFLKGSISTASFIIGALITIVAMTGGLWWATAAGRLAPLIRRLDQIPRFTSILHIDPEIAVDAVPSRSTSLRALGLSFLLHTAIATSYYYIAHAVGLSYPWLTFAASFPATQLSLMLAVTPGGLGLFDASWYGVLLLSGVPHQDAITFVIAQRAYIFVFVLIWAGVSVLLSLTVKEQQPCIKGEETN